MVYPVCCGMPQLESGDLAEVADRAAKSRPSFAPWIARGYDVVTLTASCGLMMKFEWPLILPESAAVKTLAKRHPGHLRVRHRPSPRPWRRAGPDRRARRRDPAPRLPRAGAEHGREVGRDAAADPRTPRSTWWSAARATAARSA